MIGFDHKHPHHHLDVWGHTLLALSKAPKDLEIRLVLLFHDIGKPHSYQEGEVRHYKNHSLVSSEMTQEILKRIGYEVGNKLTEDKTQFVRFSELGEVLTFLLSIFCVTTSSFRVFFFALPIIYSKII